MFGKYHWAVLVSGALLVTQSAVAQNPIQKWHRVEADNGAAFALDLNSLTRLADGGALIIVCNLDNDRCSSLNQSRFKFDCRGHCIDIDRRGPLQMAPPRSVAGRMAEIACADGKTIMTKPADTSASTEQAAGMAARRSLGLCLVAEARSAPYSDERPKVVDRTVMQTLLDRCRSQQEKWQAQCLADGRAEIWCATTSYAMVGWALDLLGR